MYNLYRMTLRACRRQGHGTNHINVEWAMPPATQVGTHSVGLASIRAADFGREVRAGRPLSRQFGGDPTPSGQPTAALPLWGAPL